tara:strand:- start:31446 stop:32366 length:921 start_codon:yes stop_codon:yes gene_type:complete
MPEKKEPFSACAGAVWIDESICRGARFLLSRFRISVCVIAYLVLMKVSLTAKIGLTIVGIVAFVLLLVTFLNYFKFQKTLAGLLDSRVRVVSLDLKSTVEGGLNLGLALRNIETLQPILDHAREINPLIATIQVYDESGNRLFSSPLSDEPTVPAEWMTALDSAETDTWSLAGETEFVVGVPLVDNLDKYVGGLSVTYSRSYFDAKVDAMLLELGEASLLALAIFGTLAFLAVFLLLRDVSAAYRRMQTAMTLAASGGVDPPDSGSRTEIETHMLMVRDYAAGAKQDIDRAAEAIDEIGRKEGLSS